MEVYDSDWINKAHHDAVELENRAMRQARCKHSYAAKRSAKLKQLANKQHIAGLGGGGGGNSKHPSKSSNLMILHNDTLMRIMKTYEITQDSLGFVKSLKATNKHLNTVIRNEMYLHQEYAHQLQTIPFLIPGTSIACNAENVESNPVIIGTEELMCHFERTGNMGVHQITVSNTYMLGFNAVRCMVDARENMFFLCIRINMENDIFLEDLQLATHKLSTTSLKFPMSCAVALISTNTRTIVHLLTLWKKKWCITTGRFVAGLTRPCKKYTTPLHASKAGRRKHARFV